MTNDILCAMMTVLFCGVVLMGVILFFTRDDARYDRKNIRKLEAELRDLESKNFDLELKIKYSVLDKLDRIEERNRGK